MYKGHEIPRDLRFNGLERFVVLSISQMILKEFPVEKEGSCVLM